MTSWAIVTGEYPPQPGGVSDYVRNVAAHLAATGDEVTVWAPQRERSLQDDKVVVRPFSLLPAFGGGDGLAEQLRSLPHDTRLLLEYAPHGFGLKGMNVPLVRLLSRIRNRPMDVMFHEVAFPSHPNRALRYRVLAKAQIGMAKVTAKRADRIFVSTLAWKPLLETIVGASLEVEWLPVPSNLPLDIPKSNAQSLRAELGGVAAFLFGHFGTYGESIRNYLTHSVPRLLSASQERHCLLLGRGAAGFRSVLVDADSAWASRIHARENLDPITLARHILACDAMVQPFPDGVSGRRGSLMASIGLGVPTITTSGRFTEPVWQSGSGVATSAATSEDFARVAEDVFRSPEQLRQLARGGFELYRDYFAVEHTIKRLRAVPDSPFSNS